MKKTIRNSSFLFIGVFIFSACSERNSGESQELVSDEVDIELVEPIQDTVLKDSIVPEKDIVPVPPEPMPPEPSPGPGPIPLPPEPPGPPIYPNPPVFEEPVSVKSIVDFPEVESEFPGGVEAMMKFISDRIQYPQVDIEMGIQGRVFVEFVVEKDGSLTEIKVLRGVSKTLDLEAMRIIRLMPKWKPGEIRGRPVRCRSRLPILFRLD